MRETSSETARYADVSKKGDRDAVDRYENVFGTGGHATEYFPVSTYRTGQREAVEQIEHYFEQGYRYVILDAPVGSGKSYIAGAFAFQSRDAHILTVQKLLQAQYADDFGEDMFVMMGRSAYKCALNTAETCANGPCKRRKLTDDEKKKHACPYRLARTMADQSEITVHNFDSFYYQNLGRPYAGRKLMICDEAHAITGKYLEFMSFTISNYRKPGLVVPEYTSIADYDVYLKEQLETIKTRITVLEDLKEASALSSSEVKELDDLGMIVTKLKHYLMNREMRGDLEYVFDYYNDTQRGYQKVTFRPVEVGDFVTHNLFIYAERVLLMSGTVLDKSIFCRELGLDPDDVAVVTVDNTFPVGNRPIIRKFAGKMSYRYIDETLPKALEILEEILRKFPDKKGIVQTHSEKIAKYIQANLHDPRLTFNKDYHTAKDMLEVHTKKPGSFIVASGLREGLDLRGDLSQIQVFFKVPYPNLNDKRVKRKMELDPDWYTYATAKMFIQALGRSVRSIDDKAVTYILDSGFGYFYHKAKRFIPDYIKEALK